MLGKYFRTSGASSLLTSLVAYWALEEASGARIDATGRGNDLSPTNTPGNAAGKVGNALSLASASLQYLSIADNTDLSTGDVDFTLACWVNLATSAVTAQEFMGKWDDLVALRREYWMGCFSSRFQFGVSSTGNNQTFQAANTLGVPSTATWYFVVGWHDSVANTINIQVNNGAVDSTSYSSGVIDSAERFTMGANRTVPANFLNGKIDEAGVWKRILTSAERTALYNSGNGRTYPFTGT